MANSTISLYSMYITVAKISGVVEAWKFVTENLTDKEINDLVAYKYQQEQGARNWQIESFVSDTGNFIEYKHL
jgi:hypothetical protein